MTPWQVFAVAAIGGFTAMVGLVAAILAGLALHTAIARLVEAHQVRSARRRALKAARRRLNTVTTIDDLKD